MRWVKRSLQGLAGMLVVLLLALAYVAWRSLPMVDGELALPGAARPGSGPARRRRRDPHPRQGPARRLDGAGLCARTGTRLAAGNEPAPDARTALRSVRQDHAGDRPADAHAGHPAGGPRADRRTGRAEPAGTEGLQRWGKRLLRPPDRDAATRVPDPAHRPQGRGCCRPLLGAGRQRRLVIDDGTRSGWELGQRAGAPVGLASAGHQGHVGAVSAVPRRAAGRFGGLGGAVPSAGCVPEHADRQHVRTALRRPPGTGHPRMGRHPGTCRQQGIEQLGGRRIAQAPAANRCWPTTRTWD